MPKVAKVVIENASLSFDKEYDYLIPESFTLEAGCRVSVPFGGYNRRVMGFVTEIIDKEDCTNLKSVYTVIDTKPLFTAEMIQMVKHMRNYTFCRYYDAVKALLPSGLGIVLDVAYKLTTKTDDGTLGELEIKILSAIKKSGGEISLKKLTVMVQGEIKQSISELINSGYLIQLFDDKQKIKDEKSVMIQLVDNEAKLTPKQRMLCDMLKEGDVSLKEALYYLPITKSVVDNLAKKGIISLYEIPSYRNPYANAEKSEEKIILSDEQEEAYNTLVKLRNEAIAKTALLYGVTGSGKTNVFLSVVRETINAGKTALIMVPEIALTPQTVENFHKIFGDKVAVLHSALTLSQRMDEWKRIKEKKADIVVGTRSAVFAPLENIGIIVIDEEQEHTYKSEQSPRFHARDIAALRCKYHNALLLLASATPSIESYYNAKEGIYSLVTLKNRYNKQKLPDVYIVDMLKSLAADNLTGISPEIIEELYINLKAGEQSVLLLNRRGYNTAVKCSVCASVAKCKNCDLPLTYHIKNNKVMCHYCGYSESSLTNCPECNSDLIRYTGVGTQLAEKDLQEIFSEARILRMDMDTTLSSYAHRDSFAAFSRGEYDIMLGTQMVAKGLNFPNVTLVGVLNPDKLLYSQNFRGFEKAFALITQVIGRSGRGEKPGRAFIQTVSRDHAVINFATAQDYDSFYKEEIKFRKLNLYPPFCKFTGVVLVSERENIIKPAAKYASDILQTLAKEKYSNLPLRILNPVPSPIFKAGGKYRYRILIKHKHTASTYKLFWDLLTKFTESKEFNKINIIIDTNYDG